MVHIHGFHQCPFQNLMLILFLLQRTADVLAGLLYLTVHFHFLYFNST